MNNWRIKVDFFCCLALALTAIVTIGYCIATRPQEDTSELTTASTTQETTEASTFPTEAEETVTEPSEAPETIPEVTLYDIPLDEDLQLFIIEQAEAKGIDPAIVMAMAWKESTYNTDAEGDSGASLGLMQVQPRWHYQRMQNLDCLDLLDPYQNVTVALDYLKELVDTYGCIEIALVAYNQGHFSGEITDYAYTVLDKADDLRGETYVLFR